MATVIDGTMHSEGVDARAVERGDTGSKIFVAPRGSSGWVNSFTGPLSNRDKKLNPESPLDMVVAQLRHLVMYLDSLLVGSKSFEKIAYNVFKSCDLGGDRALDQAEFYTCMLLLYDQVNAKLPTHVLVPSKQDVQNLFKKYDTNKDGKLEFQEFLRLARRLFGLGCATELRNSIPYKVAFILLLRLAILPTVAIMIRTLSSKIGLMPLAIIPVMVYSVLLETLGRYFLALV